MDLYQIKCTGSNRIASMIVLNSRKHHQGLNNPAPFRTWAPKVDQEYRVFGATTTRFNATGEERHNHIMADFEVFRDNLD
eukprot:10841039-Heterocapsa_arctica.AAC.1